MVEYDLIEVLQKFDEIEVVVLAKEILSCLEIHSSEKLQFILQVCRQSL